MFLVIFGVCSAFVHGISSLSFYWIVIGMIHVYFLIVIYSIYELIEYEGEQKVCHQSSPPSQGYNKRHEEPGALNDSEKGYQTSEFQGP